METLIIAKRAGTVLEGTTSNGFQCLRSINHAKPNIFHYYLEDLVGKHNHHKFFKAELFGRANNLCQNWTTYGEEVTLEYHWRIVDTMLYAPSCPNFLTSERYKKTEEMTKNLQDVLGVRTLIDRGACRAAQAHLWQE